MKPRKTQETTMDKSTENKKHYWGITENGTTVFEGSFNDCWKKLLEEYATWTVSELESGRIRITRIG